MAPACKWTACVWASKQRHAAKPLQHYCGQHGGKRWCKSGVFAEHGLPYPLNVCLVFKVISFCSVDECCQSCACYATLKEQIYGCHANTGEADCLEQQLQPSQHEVMHHIQCEKAMAAGEKERENHTSVGSGICKDHPDGRNSLCRLLQCVLELVQLWVVLHTYTWC